MAFLTTLRDADIRDLAASFELGAVRSWRSIAAGTINSNFEIEAEGGRYFLRVNEGKSRAEVEYECAVLQHWVNFGLCTALPLQARSGHRFAEHGGQFISVFPWLPGRHFDSYSIQAGHCRSLGAVLADLHRGGLEAGPDLLRETRYGHEALRALYEGFAHSSDPELLEAISLLGDEFSYLEGLSVERGDLERGLIHADLFPDNVLMSADGAPEDAQVCSLLDFEQACVGALVYDVAVTINAWCFADELEEDRLRSLVEGYRGTRSAPLDASVLLVELRAAALRFAITRVTDVYLGAGQAGGKDFRRFVMRLKTWQSMTPEHLSALLA